MQRVVVVVVSVASIINTYKLSYPKIAAKDLRISNWFSLGVLLELVLRTIVPTYLSYNS